MLSVYHTERNYIYQIAETKGGIADLTYDTKVIEVIVKRLKNLRVLLRA